MAVCIDDQKYKAGYKWPYGIRIFYAAAALLIICHMYMGIHMLYTYLEFSRLHFSETAPIMPQLLVFVIYNISLAFVVTVFCIAHYIHVNSIVRDKSLQIRTDGIIWLSKDVKIREIVWQDVISLKCLNASGNRTPFMHLVTSSGCVTIHGAYLLDARKAIELIRNNANLPSEHKGVFWTEFQKPGVFEVGPETSSG